MQALPGRERESSDGPGPFLRLVRRNSKWFELQTAVVTYEAEGFTGSEGESPPRQVELVAMVHLADPWYYKDLQALAGKQDRVLYELITDTQDIEEDARGLKRLRERMLPAWSQTMAAKSHGLQAQLEALDYSDPRWFLADLDRETIQRLQRARGEGGTPGTAQAIAAGWGTGDSTALPEPFRALIRNWLRAPLWLVPCPEGAMLTLDWALSKRGALSEVLSAMWGALIELDIATIRKLSFAQLLASGIMVCDGPQTVIISERNKVAVAELDRALADGCERTALLYGGLHGDDLDARLTGQLGLKRTNTRWLTAWRIRVPEQTDAFPKTLLAAGAAFLTLDAADWVLTFTAVAESVSEGAVSGALGLFLLYVFRHGLLYSAVGRWMVSWDRPLFLGAAASIEDASPRRPASRGTPPGSALRQDQPLDTTVLPRDVERDTTVLPKDETDM